MALFRQKYRVESMRLQAWDYSAAGWYFVTICTRGSVCFFGDVVDGGMRLSMVGVAAQRFWLEIPDHFREARLDEFAVMPNHIHGIVIIDRRAQTQHVENVETRHVASLQHLHRDIPNKFGPLKPGSLQAIIHAYKAAVTRWCRKNGQKGFAWQPRFYDHIIRNEGSLNDIREYIINNPMKWELDKDNPANLYM